MANVIYKDNNLIEASYALTLSEQRLILIAIIAARDIEKELTADTLITIHASQYMQHFNVERQSAYDALQSASDSLFERRLSYKAIDPVTGRQAIYKSRWVSKVGYVKEAATVQLIFAPDILPLFIKLEEKFTKYELKQISQLTSVYAIRLYELLIRWRSTGRLYIKINELRNKLGLSDEEYIQMGDFKKRVLNTAIEQINEFTDIEVNYNQKKEGRSITDIDFVFERKKSSLSNQGTTELNYKLTAQQCLYFANKLCDLTNYPQFGMKYANIGESAENFKERIAYELLETKNVQKYYIYLKEVGYKDKLKTVR
jgi:plasmid replication initiation protein